MNINIDPYCCMVMDSDMALSNSTGQDFTMIHSTS